MRINKIEILKNTGDNQYDEILYPKTTINNVITSSNNTLDQELKNCIESISGFENSSKSIYVIRETCSKIKINNINFIYLDSGLSVYYNGLLLAENLHYIVLNTNEIELIGFEASVGDEVIFEVINKFKPNINLEYKSFPKDTQEALDNLLNSTNFMISEINNFKNKLIIYLKNIDIDISMSNSYEEVATAIYQNLKTKSAIKTDLGVLFGKPNFEYDIDFSLGSVFGIENTVSYFGNDLGGL